jgi:hypothetical protein
VLRTPSLRAVEAAMQAGLRLKVSRCRHGGVSTAVDSLVATGEYFKWRYFFGWVFGEEAKGGRDQYNRELQRASLQ